MKLTLETCSSDRHSKYTYQLLENGICKAIADRYLKILIISIKYQYNQQQIQKLNNQRKQIYELKKQTIETHIMEKKQQNLYELYGTNSCSDIDRGSEISLTPSEIETTPRQLGHDFEKPIEQISHVVETYRLEIQYRQEQEPGNKYKYWKLTLTIDYN